MPLVIDQSRQSPNHSSRDGAPIRLIVMHATVGSFVSSLNWLCSPASQVSAHYIISKQGKIAQLVADKRAAWHAGASFWNDMDSEEIQDSSIGIELENLTGMRLANGTLHPADPYPGVQIAAARELVRVKMREHGIPLTHIVRHADIAIPRGRKTDPANFPWTTFIQSLATDSPGHYRVRGVAVHEGPGIQFPVALGGTAVLPSGSEIEIDEIKPGGWGHLEDGRGFVLLKQLEAMP